MKLIILKSNLRDGLSAIERAITENNKLPILKNVLIKTIDGIVKLSATNLELGINRLISGKIIEKGAITVPFQTFYSITNNSDSERINLEVDNNNLIFKTDNYEAKIQGIKEEEFPIIPKIENENNFIEIDPVILKDALLRVSSAAQISEIRPEISGVLFDFQITILKLVATDSFRLAEKTLYDREYKTNFNRGFKCIVPLKTIQEAIRIFNDEKLIKIYIDSTQILFKNEDVELISRLIDGEYPDYEQIIPKEIETETVIGRDYFINALKLVSNFSSNINDVRLKMEKDGKNLEIYSAHQYLGENCYVVPAKIKGEGVKEITFNWKFLLNGLKATKESKNLIFGICGDSRPAIIKSPDDNSYFYILMPIKA